MSVNRKIEKVIKNWAKKNGKNKEKKSGEKCDFI